MEPFKGYFRLKLKGAVILKDTIPDFSSTSNKMAISKFCLDVFVEMMGAGGVIRPLITFYYLKGH